MKPLPVPFHALVLAEEKRKTKAGDRFFWKMVIRTVAGDISGLMWNAPANAETDPHFPHVGDIIQVDSFEDNIAERGAVVISSFERVTKDTVPEEERGIIAIDCASEEDIAYALDRIRSADSWDSVDNHTFAMRCLEAAGFEQFKICPAATHVHHHYQGGLLVHTAEVLGLCKAICEESRKRYSFINRDVLYCAAILHDIGKIKTYSVDEIGLPHKTVTEKTIGHLFYSMYLVQNQAEKHQVPGQFVDEVLHCIASHHGLPEWGSLKVVQSIEAGILSRADYISSRNGMVEYILKESVKTGQTLQDDFKVYGDSYFTSIGMKKYVEGT